MAEEGWTLGDLLGFRDTAAPPVRAAVERVAEAWPLPGGERIRAGAAARAVDVLERALAVPLDQLLADAWRSWDQARAYCDPALHPPGETETVPLVEHTVEWRCEPVVEVVTGAGPAAATVAVVNFEVAVEVTLRGGDLVIGDGRFLRLESASAAYELKVSAEGIDFGPWMGTLKLPSVLRFGEGIPICPDRAERTAPAEAAVST